MLNEALPGGDVLMLSGEGMDFALFDQIGGLGLAAIIVGVIVVAVIVKVVFSILRKVLAVIITVALLGVLGASLAGVATGAFDASGFFGTIFSNMPWL